MNLQQPYQIPKRLLVKYHLKIKLHQVELIVIRKFLLFQRHLATYLVIKETYNERNQLHLAKRRAEEKEKVRGTDTLVSRVDETRPDIGVPHHVRRNRVERGTSATLSEPFTIRSRETYRFHGSDPLPFHQGSLVDALFATTIHVCVCVCLRSFSSLRIVSRTIEYPAWVVEPARIVFLEKALLFLRCYFLFAPCQSRERGN